MTFVYNKALDVFSNPMRTRLKNCKFTIWWKRSIRCSFECSERDIEMKVGGIAGEGDIAVYGIQYIYPSQLVPNEQRRGRFLLNLLFIVNNIFHCSFLSVWIHLKTYCIQYSYSLHIYCGFTSRPANIKMTDYTLILASIFKWIKALSNLNDDDQ